MGAPGVCYDIDGHWWHAAGSCEFCKGAPIVNWIVMPYLNCPALTRRAIEDCLTQSIPVSLLLIDNGSQDEGRQIGDDYQRSHANVLCWHHDPPLPALAAVWNRALRFVWEAGGEYAWVVNNDARFHPETYEVLLEVQRATHAYFVSAVSVREGQFDPTIDLRQSLGTITESRKDGVRPEGYSYGGPDFSCYLITRECHRWFQFDEGFIPAYHEDNDFHRRLQLAGFGDKIFGVNVPFLHYGSGTLEGNPKLKAGWHPKFTACQEYYRQKWGDLPSKEIYQTPFGGPHEEMNRITLEVVEGQPRDPRVLMTGQGKPGGIMEGTEAIFG